MRNDLRDCGWCSGGEGDIKKMRREVNGGKGKVVLVACVLWRFLKRFASRSLRGGSLTALQRLFSGVYSFFECLSWLFIEWLHWGYVMGMLLLVRQSRNEIKMCGGHITCMVIKNVLISLRFKIRLACLRNLSKYIFLVEIHRKYCKKERVYCGVITWVYAC